MFVRSMVIIKFTKSCTRQLHTIVSKQIIKPSSPTPPHLQIYNLSSIDQMAPDAYFPMVIFYQTSITNPNFHSNTLKNSLSQTLVHYYPFAGRLSKTTPSFVHCKDQGVEVLESVNDNALPDFLNNMQHEDLDQLFPNRLLWNKFRDYSLENDSSASPLAVQINRFSCGGIAVAVSLSHKITDGNGLCNFFNDWARMTRLQSRIEPRFVSFERVNLNYQGVSLDGSREGSVTRSFVFSGSKINDLKHKVIAMTTEAKQPISNPTRLEVLSWLLYKCSLQAATHKKAGSFKPSGFAVVTNIRNKMIEPLAKTTIGNFYSLPAFSTENPSMLTPGSFISQLRNLKMEVGQLQNIKKAVEIVPNMSVFREEQRKFDESYVFISLCRYPLYGIDFGWGKPVKVAMAGTALHNSFFAMDAPNDDGIEVFVSLGKEDMEVFGTNPLLRSFCS